MLLSRFSAMPKNLIIKEKSKTISGPQCKKIKGFIKIIHKKSHFTFE